MKGAITMLKLVIGILVVITLTTNVHAAWWNTSFAHCQDITITPPESGTLADFPLFVAVPYHATMRSDYRDLRFINASCHDDGSELEYHIEYSNSTVAHSWVNVDTISGTTTISVYYGNSDALDVQDADATYNSEYDIVYNLATGGSNLADTINDRVADVGAPTQQTGPLGYELALDGNDAWSQADMPYWEQAWTERVHEVVFRTGSDVSTRQALFAEGGGTNGIMLYIVSNNVHARWWSESDGWSGQDINQSVQANTLYHAAMDFDSTGSARLFVNGNFSGSFSPPSGIAAHTGDGGIGYTNTNKDFHDLANTGPAYFVGDLLELRTMSNQQTSGWYNLSYESMVTPSSAVNLGPVQAQAPIILNVSVNQSTFYQGDDALVTVIIEETLGTHYTTSVIASLLYPDSSTLNHSLTQSVLLNQNVVSSDQEPGIVSFNASSGLTTIGESGAVSLGAANYTIAFTQTYDSTPIIIATPTTENSGVDGGETFVIESKNTTHAIVNMCKDDGATGCEAAPTNETFHYFVFDVAYATTYSWMEIGTVTGTTNGGDTVVTFNNTFTNVPYVFATVQTNNDGGSIVAPSIWTDTATVNDVQIIGCVHSGSGDTCTTGASETYAYVAIDPTLLNITDMQVGSANIADSTWTAATLSPTITTPRVMVMQNDDDGGQDPEYHEARSVTSSGFDFRYCEMDASNVCNTHTDEITRWFALPDGVITVNGVPADDDNTTFTTYSNVLSPLVYNITQVTVSVTLTAYNNSGSTNRSNNDSDAEVYVYNGSTYVNLGLLGADTVGTFSTSTTDASILSAWESVGNRDVRLRGVYGDWVSDTDRDLFMYDTLTVRIDYHNETGTWTYTIFNLTQEGLHNVTQVNATNEGGGENVTQYNTTTFTVLADTPEITNVRNQSITDVSAIILWDTNELANSSVLWGNTTSLGNNTVDSSFVTAHSVLLTDLVPLMTYYYNVTSCDYFGNCNTSTQYNFTTLAVPDVTAPNITDVAVVNITENEAVVVWNTSELANATVEFGVTLSFGTNVTRDTYFDAHAITLTGLSPLVQYFLNVTSCDPSGNCNTSGPYNFTTPDLTPPNWSNMQTHPANNSEYAPGQLYSFNVSWTDVFGVNTTIIEHNFSGSFVNASTVQYGDVYHFNVSDLIPGTYQWRMYANDSSGNQNQTNAFTYVVTKATPSLTLTLNGSSSSISMTTGSTIPIVANVTNPSGSNVTIYRDGSTIASGPSHQASNETFLIQAFYNITAFYAGNENYSSATVTYFVNAIKPRILVPNTVLAENDIATLNLLTTSQDITLSNTYDLTRTFLTLRYASDGTAGLAPDDSTASAYFVNGSTIRIERYTAGQNLYASYSVLQSTNIQVWNWTYSWSSGEESATVDLASNITDSYATKCFIEAHRNMRLNTTDVNSYGENEVRVDFVNTTQLALTRDTETANTADPGVQYGYVVCFRDDSTVQSNTFSLSGDVGTEQTASIDPVVVNESWTTMHHYAADSGVGQNSLIANLTSATVVTLMRDEIGNGQAANGRYFVVSFEQDTGAYVQNVRYEAPGTGTALTYTTQSFDAVDQNRSYLQCQNTMGNGGGTAHTRANWAFELNASSDGVFMQEGRDRSDTQFSDVSCYVTTWPNQTTYREPAELLITNITFTPSVSVEGQLVQANVTVLNNGSQEAENITVQMNISRWNGSDWIDSVFSNQTIVLLDNGTSTNLTYNWTAYPGTYNFEASVDIADQVAEANETNNVFSANHTTSSWHVFYGEANTNMLVLSSGGPTNFTFWLGDDDVGNIYVYDSDAAVDFLTLEPLNSTGDLLEADGALNMTGNNDSLAALFDRNDDQIADDYFQFTVAGVNMSVPVINSTNSSQFLTGVFWDNPGGDPEFNGSQPLVFVTEFNGTYDGLYGTYDYELALPSLLRRQLASTDSVDFVVEFR